MYSRDRINNKYKETTPTSFSSNYEQSRLQELGIDHNQLNFSLGDDFPLAGGPTNTNLVLKTTSTETTTQQQQQQQNTSSTSNFNNRISSSLGTLRFGPLRRKKEEEEEIYTNNNDQQRNYHRSMSTNPIRSLKRKMDKPLLINNSMITPGGQLGDGNADDPYYYMKDVLLSVMSKVDKSFLRFVHLLENTNTAEGSEFRKLNSALMRDVESALDALKQMDASVMTVERAPAQFQHVDSAELQARKEFCSEVRSKLRKVKQKMQHDRSTLAKLESDKRKLLLARRKDNAPAIGNSRGPGGSSNAAFVDSQRQRQLMLRKQQDDQLGDLSRGVDVLDEAANEINVELEIQGRMMDEIEDDMDHVQAKMGFVMGGMAKLLKTKNRYALYLILFLMLAIFILAILLFKT